MCRSARRARVQEIVKSDLGQIRRSRVYEEVARQIRCRILEKLRPGDKLPPERELAETLSVSRSSVRDAIRSLELLGLVDPRSGSGTLVCEISTDRVVNPLANALAHRRQWVIELLDFRKMLEPSLASRAAKRASPAEIAEMEEILVRQEEKVRRGEIATDQDAEFHYGVAMASDNSVVLKVLDIVMDLLLETRERSLQVGGRPQKSLVGHRRILAAIKRRNASAAEDAMRQHIQDIEDIVIGKL
jgi:GntR family transcriptional regulator, transcriptional repressor for pyruvate dehydrogenase complex